ncbi:hypothetical protein [Corynebacterium glyciniphilum]|nr:hypothetical protein [Corynebacterium glyciniphilum]
MMNTILRSLVAVALIILFALTTREIFSAEIYVIAKISALLLAVALLILVTGFFAILLPDISPIRYSWVSEKTSKAVTLKSYLVEVLFFAFFLTTLACILSGFFDPSMAHRWKGRLAVAGLVGIPVLCWMLWHLSTRNFKPGLLVANEGQIYIKGNSNANVRVGDSTRLVVKPRLFRPTIDIVDLDGKSILPNSNVLAQFYFSSPRHLAASLAHALSVPVEKI